MSGKPTFKIQAHLLVPVPVAMSLDVLRLEFGTLASEMMLDALGERVTVGPVGALVG